MSGSARSISRVSSKPFEAKKSPERLSFSLQTDQLVLRRRRTAEMQDFFRARYDPHAGENYASCGEFY